MLGRGAYDELENPANPLKSLYLPVQMDSRGGPETGRVVWRYRTPRSYISAGTILPDVTKTIFMWAMIEALWRKRFGGAWRKWERQIEPDQGYYENDWIDYEIVAGHP